MQTVKKLGRLIGAKAYIFAHKCKNGLNHLYYQSKFGGNTESLILKGRIFCINPENVKVGESCCINDRVTMHAGGRITLADHVTISTDAKIISRSYDTSDWVAQCLSDNAEKEHVADEIVLGSHTWVGASAIILPGVKITGKGVIIAAGSVLNKSVAEDYVLVAGSPAKVIKKYG